MKQDKIYTPIYHTTWCAADEYPAAKVLALILNEYEDNFLTKKVSIHINRFFKRLNSILLLKDCKIYFAHLLIKDTKKNIIEYNYPKNVETHLINFLIGVYRKKIHQLPLKDIN